MVMGPEQATPGEQRIVAGTDAVEARRASIISEDMAANLGMAVAGARRRACPPRAHAQEGLKASYRHPAAEPAC